MDPRHFAPRPSVEVIAQRRARRSSSGMFCLSGYLKHPNSFFLGLKKSNYLFDFCVCVHINKMSAMPSRAGLSPHSKVSIHNKHGHIGSIVNASAEYSTLQTATYVFYYLFFICFLFIFYFLLC